MMMVTDSAQELKRCLKFTAPGEFARSMVLRLVLTFIMQRGRMSCSRAGGAIRTEPVHRSRITRFLARPRWQQADFNAPLRAAMLQMESGKGKYSSSKWGRQTPHGESLLRRRRYTT